jgi:hypothetical protein
MRLLYAIALGPLGLGFLYVLAVLPGHNPVKAAAWTFIGQAGVAVAMRLGFIVSKILG